MWHNSPVRMLHIALLRAINLGGHNKIGMPDLRALVSGLGFGGVQSLLHTGNLVFDGGKATPGALERKLEAALERELGISTDVFVRTAREWGAMMAANPFARDAADNPSRLAVLCLKSAPRPAQLTALRTVGVRMAQGPLFAGDDWAPGDRVTQIPALSLEPLAPDSGAGLRVSEFMVPAVTMTVEATSEEVLEAFSADSALNSVILLDHRERPVAALDRARFLLSITGPYGHALYAKRPAQKLADPPRTVPLTAPALAALRIAGTDQDRVYDDLIAVNEFGQCRGVVHISDIIRGLSAR